LEAAVAEIRRGKEELQRDRRQLAAERECPALLLVGGLGTRLRSVLPASPKPLAPLGQTPFLRILVKQLSSQGIRRLILCTGHLGAKIEEEFGAGRELGVRIEYSRELSPLGTAGAVKFAERHVDGCSEFIVMNGDSFLELDFAQMLSFHREHGGLISIAVRSVADAARYGTVQADDKLRVIGFREKTEEQGPGLINGGVYVFDREVFEYIPGGSVSLERDIFPKMLEFGVYAFEQHGLFVDIGTPEDYARAQTIGSSLREAADSKPQLGRSQSHP
jgi:NDP-sugar pyrophosphorylase family protein